MIIVILCSCAAVMCLAVESAVAESADHLQQEAEKIRKQIEQKSIRKRRYGKQEAEAVQNLRSLEKSIHAAQKQLARTKAELSGVQKRIAGNQQELNALDDRIVKSEAYIAKRFCSLYKLNALGRLAILASADSIGTFFERKHSLETILDYDQGLVKSLAAQKAARQKKAASLEAEQTSLSGVVKKHRQAQKLLSHQQKQKKNVLKNIRHKKRLVKAAIDALRADSRAVRERIRQLESEMDESGIPKNGGGAFAALKGLLNMPVDGTIVSWFSSKRKSSQINIQSGIDIAAKSGAKVRAVSAGTVIYANWFRGYGNMMIIDHGGHYYTVYAHNDELFSARGSRVAAGDVIATVGDTGTAGTPTLHFEVRHHGTPLNPVKWLKTG